jgi:hypothetical protein
MKNKITLRFGVLAGIVGLATVTRVAIPPILGHPSNFSPIDAIALFSGCYFAGKFSKFLVPLLAVWVGDLFVNFFALGKWTLFYEGFYWQYASYVMIVMLGMALSKRVKPLSLMGMSLASSLLFFLVSNFGVWASWSLYPHTATGLTACYAAGIPFFGSTLISDLCYSAVLFGVFELASKKYSVLSLSGEKA